MSFLAAFLYDHFMTTVERSCLKEWRHELLEQVSGEVLEIGAGTGANLEFYPETVTRLVLTEPDQHMRQFLQKNTHHSKLKDIHIANETAEDLDADDESFDFVVTALVCCSFADLEAALLEIRRVLKPGGSLLFMEHVAADDGTGRRYWQNLVNPIWRKVMGNCHLNREIEGAMISVGFNIRQIKRESMRTIIAPLLPTIRGCAQKI